MLWKKAIYGTDPHHTLNLLTPRFWTFQNCEKPISILYTLPSLRYFVLAAKTGSQEKAT
jgi:hypothetical protein